MSSHPRLLSRTGFAVLFAVWVSGCDSTPPVVQTPPPPVTVSQPVVQKIVDHDDYEGQIAARPKIDVRARVKGHLQKVNFEDGQMVEKGRLLFIIDPRPYEEMLQAATAQEKSAQAQVSWTAAEYARVRSLVVKGAASREELEVWNTKQMTAKGDLLKTEAAVRKAKLDLGYTKITAEIDGRISRTQVDVGNLVNAGGGETLLTTLMSVDPIYVYFGVDERSLLRYRRDYAKGKKPTGKPIDIKALKIPVYVALEGEEGYPHKGVIDFADNRVNPNTGTIQVRGILSNKSNLANDGMRARVRVPVSDPRKAVMITERAVGSDQGRKFVYVVNAENVAERRDVTLDRVVDGLQVIREGVKPNDLVVINGIQRVRDGMKVEPKQGPMPGVKQAGESE